MRVLIVSLSTYSSKFNDGKLAELGRYVGHVTAVAASRPTLWGAREGDRRSDTHEVFLLEPVLAQSNATTLLRGLGRLANIARPTLIHVECEPWQGVALQSILLARKLRVPVGVQFAENGPMLRGPAGRVRVRVGRWALKQCEYAIGWSAGSAAVARELAPGLPVAMYPGTGVDAPRLDRRSGAGSERWFGGGKENSARIAYVGRFSPEKGLADFLATVDRLAARLPLEVAIAGGSPSHPFVRDWLRPRKWARAHGVLPRTNVLDLLEASDVLVSPSRTTSHVKEQFGLAPIEAMSQGTPVFGFDCGALREVIGAGGVVVPEGRVDLLVDELERHLNAPVSVKDKLSRRALARAEQFTNAALARGLTRMWLDLGLVTSNRGRA